MKLVFAPFSVVAGYAAGLGGKKAFEAIWARIDDEEPPGPDQRDAPAAKMLVALALQGAIFYVVRGVADHQLRRGFAALTGSWPGDKRADDA